MNSALFSDLGQRHFPNHADGGVDIEDDMHLYN
jgi:hypothetical protein